MSTDPECTDLIARVASGDEAALGELYDRYGRAIFSLARQLTGSERDAEEVVQDVFVGVWAGASRFDAERAALFTWMVTMARNKAYDVLRKVGAVRPPIVRTRMMAVRWNMWTPRPIRGRALSFANAVRWWRRGFARSRRSNRSPSSWHFLTACRIARSRSARGWRWGRSNRESGSVLRLCGKNSWEAGSDDPRRLQGSRSRICVRHIGSGRARALRAIARARWGTANLRR